LQRIGDLGENVVVIALHSRRSKTPKHSHYLRDNTYCQTDIFILTLRGVRKEKVDE